jgi:transcriptional regulator with XRE-family HTH domain
MDADGATIGGRLRMLRHWRGMTQTELGGLAGIAPSLISMIENGQRPLDRRSSISAIAAALRVSETELTDGPHLSADRLQSEPHAGIPALRRALLTNSLTQPVTDRARPAGELAAQVEVIGRLFRSCDYTAIGQRLPAVIDELHVHVSASAGEPGSTAALGTLIDACVCASRTASALGYPDLAHVAAQRAQEAAEALDDPAGLGKAAFLRFHTAPRDPESWDRARLIAERAAGALEPHARSADSACVLGMLTLSAALASAVLQQGQAADHWLAESAAIATRVPDDMSGNWMSFGTTNVAVWRAALAVERGESGGRMLELASAVDETRLTAGSRLADFRADIGRGLARDPRSRGEAVRWLRRAESTAPQRIRNSAPAREAVAYLLSSSRASAGGRELRGMAARMSVPR